MLGPFAHRRRCNGTRRVGVVCVEWTQMTLIDASPPCGQAGIASSEYLATLTGRYQRPR